ncbi:MAG: hypothetical protein H6581_22060 [Bacteroidia bacterium]|nr:hypothetical protein [Bacteroidia bacterium]
MENEIKRTKTAEPEAAPKPAKKSRFSARDVDKALRFVLFLTGIGLVYIWNSSHAQKQVRTMDALTKEIHEMKSEYTTLSAELSFGTRQSEIAQQVDTLGLKQLKIAPYKLEIGRD